MNAKISTLLTSLLVMLCCFSSSGQGPQKIITINSDHNMTPFPTLVYTPIGYSTSGQNYPLIVFLHGTGEASGTAVNDPGYLAGNYLGNIYNSSSAGGPAYYIASGQWPDSFANPTTGVYSHYIVISPQAPGWSTAGSQLNYIISNFIAAGYRVDVNRIYVTGLSAGGQGVIDYVNHNGVTPIYEAAAVIPMSMATGTDSAGAQIAAGNNIRAWGFGSDPSDVHGVATHQQMDIMNFYSPGIARFTNYSGGHCCWGQFYTPTYTEVINGKSMNIYQWMLLSSRGTAAPTGSTPTANAGAAQSIQLPVSQASLSGSGSTDAGGTITTYAWSQQSGPSTATIATPSAVTTSVTGLVAGVYVFKLTITDNNKNTSSSTVQVTVSAAGSTPSTPLANAGAAQNIVLPISQVTLSAAASTDAGGTITAYAWTPLAGPAPVVIATPSAVSTTVTGLIAGLYVFKLTITDNNGNVSSANVNVTVAAATGSTPTANAGVAQSIQLPVSQASLSGSGSTDAGGTITTYAWSQQSGPSTATIVTASAVATSVTGLVAGTYVFNLTITDNNNKTSSSTVPVTVLPAAGKSGTPSTPLANAGTAQTIVLPVSQVTLNAAGSTDAGGTITAYSWVPMAGPAPVVIATPSAASTTVTGLIAGLYVFKLTITDNNGNTSTANVNVTVTAAASSTPSANPGAAQAIQLPVSQVSLSGAGSTDAGGTITAYAWSQQSGPSTATLTTPAAVSTTATGLTAGVYIFKLTVTDNNNNTSSATIQVSVSAAVVSTPAANAGAAQSIQLPVSVASLSGSGSTDAGGTITAYAWSQQSGPSTAVLTAPTAVITSATGLVAGVYVFNLTITDNTGKTSSATTQVTVLSALPPVVSCGGKRKVLSISGNDNGQWISGQNSGINPGDTLVLSSKYRWFYLSGDGLHGTASCPIVITNDSGQVEMTAGIAFSNSTYLHITGTGSAGYFYGFNIHSYDSIAPWQRGSSITLSDRSAFVEIDHIDEYKKSNAVVIKEEAMCPDSLIAPNWRLDNFSIHDIRSRNISYEGFYLGSLSTNGENTISCNGVSSSPIPMRLSNIKLYNLIIDSTGGNAIQLSGADSGANEISNCKISRSGLFFDPNQGTGIYLGGYTSAYVHDNNIRSTFQNGISCYGAGLMRLENNNIDSSGFLSGKTNSGMSSIVADTRLTTNKGATPAGILSTISLKNNTVGLTTNTAGAISAYRSIDIGLSYSTYPTWSAANVICSNVLQNGTTAAEFRINPAIVYTANCSGVTGAATGSKLMSVSGLSFDEPAANAFIIYPNPTHDECSIQLSNSNMGNMRVLIVDVAGVIRRQYDYNKSGQSIQADLYTGDLAAGVYFIRVQIGAWSVVRKIFKL